MSTEHERNEQNINDAGSVVRKYSVDPKYALLLKHVNSFKANLEGESSVKIEIVSLGYENDPEANGVIKITGKERNVLFCINNFDFSKENEGFAEIDTTKVISELMFTNFENDKSKIMIDHECKIFIAPEHSGKIYIYGLKSNLDAIKSAIDILIEKVKQTIPNYIITSEIPAEEEDSIMI